jgi:benzoyl-CoA-dihydrodiol lyase
VIEPGSCFAGSLLELALAADRSYMLDTPDAPAANTLALSPLNFGDLPMVNGLSRLAARFYEEAAPLAALRGELGQAITAAQAMELGLITAAPDDLDWADEVRIAIEERVALSPDALTGLEANLRFGPTESMNTRIFGRLSAWQNWIFIRPNAVGPAGALKVFGSGKKPQFDWQRV